MLFNEGFQIIAKVNLYDEDYKVLNLLYNPLIGLETICLYQTLYFLSKNKHCVLENSYKHLFLFDLVNIREDYFIELKRKLEAFNLLETYKNQQKGISYVLYSPLKHTNFFNDPLFSQFLLSEVGYQVYNSLVSFFSEEELVLNNNDNISIKFKDLYETKKINLKEDIFYQDHHKKINCSFFDSDFNYELFIESLPERFKKPILIEWKSIDYLKKLSFVYDITPQALAKLYVVTFAKNIDYNHLDLNMLKMNLTKKNYQKYANTKIVFYPKNHNDEEEMINFLKNTSPQRIIQKYCQNNYRSSVSETVCELVERTNVEPGMINALLIYILKLKEGILPTVSYLETVLKNWFKKGIISTEDAYDFLMEDNKKINKYSKYEKHSPNWLKNVQENLEFADNIVKDKKN